MKAQNITKIIVETKIMEKIIIELIIFVVKTI